MLSLMAPRVCTLVPSIFSTFRLGGLISHSDIFNSFIPSHSNEFDIGGLSIDFSLTESSGSQP